jgi:hypothetical protein
MKHAPWSALVILGLSLSLLVAQGLEAAPHALRASAHPNAAPAPWDTHAPQDDIVTVTIDAHKDNTLYEDRDGSLSNSKGSYLFAGATRTGNARRGLIAFDIAGHIPPGSIIVDATLRLHMSKTIAGSQTVTLHRVLADWGEGTSQAGGDEGSGAPAARGDATWLHRFYETEFWATRGGDFQVPGSASAIVDGTGAYTWASTPQLVSDVKSWLDYPQTNFGWLILGFEGGPSTAKRFNSREHPEADTRPLLTVRYWLGYRAHLPIMQKN